MEGGSKPESHPSFPDENDANDASFAGLIFEQNSRILGIFSRKMNDQKLDFLDASHSFDLPGIARVLGKTKNCSFGGAARHPEKKQFKQKRTFKKSGCPEIQQK